MNKESRSHSSILLLTDDDTDVNELRECYANKEVHPSGWKKGLKMASLIVNGLLSKIDEIRQLAKNEKIDIFAINETKINDKVKDQLVDIDEFDLKRSESDRHGGGVALHIRNTVSFKLRDDLLNKSLEVRATNARFHKNRAFNEESMKIGISIDLDMLKTIRSGPQL